MVQRIADTTFEQRCQVAAVALEQSSPDIAGFLQRDSGDEIDGDRSAGGRVFDLAAKLGLEPGKSLFEVHGDLPLVRPQVRAMDESIWLAIEHKVDLCPVTITIDNLQLSAEVELLEYLEIRTWTAA